MSEESCLFFFFLKNFKKKKKKKKKKPTKKKKRKRKRKKKKKKWIRIRSCVLNGVKKKKTIRRFSVYPGSFHCPLSLDKTGGGNHFHRFGNFLDVPGCVNAHLN